MSFRKVIMQEVKRQQLTGYRLARLCDVPMRTVQKYLAGDCDLVGERLSKIAHALGLKLRPTRRGQRTKGA